MRLPDRDTELLQIMDAALADAALRAGPWLVCRPGCTPCCHGAFAIGALDIARLRVGMEALRAADPVQAAQVEQRAQDWLATHVQEFPGDLQTGVLGASDAEQERFEEYANEAACPALDPETGRCAVYAHRPMTCRVFGPPVRMGEGDGFGHCELCFERATEEEVAACEMQIPHALEAELLDEMATRGETVVAFALLRAT